MIRILILLGIVCASCVNTPSNGAYLHSNTDLKDTTTYTYGNYKEISKYFSGQGDQIDTSYYRISFPIFSNDSLNKTIGAAILLEGEEKPEQAAESFLSGYNEYVEESSTTLVTAWHKDVQANILINTPLIVSIKTAVNEYTGGAHGIHYAVLSNYDIQTNKKIELKDLLLPNRMPKLVNIGEKYFRAQENLSDTSSLVKDYFFDHGIFVLNDNFGLTKSDLIVYYSEYEIKPYAEGATILRIPYHELGGILNERGKEYINSIQ